MNHPENYPPIDSELAETVWPTILQQGEETAKLRDVEFQQMVQAGAVAWTPDLYRDGALKATDTTITSSDGEEQLPVLTVKPAAGTEPLPCIYYVANGGKMAQDSRMALTDVEGQWVEELGLALVSVAPRVGPEHRHPAQVEDAYAGLVWLAEHAHELGIDPTRIMVMGKSGGGGIAASLALYARDQGGPALSRQLLICPMIDDRGQDVSSQYQVPPWTSENNRVGWQAILGEKSGGADVSPYAAAARAEELTQLPAAYLEVGSSEVFRDETLDYALRLARAGVSTEVHAWDGGFHSFEIFAPDTRISHACLATRRSYLERAIGTGVGDEAP